MSNAALLSLPVPVFNAFSEVYRSLLPLFLSQLSFSVPDSVQDDWFLGSILHQLLNFLLCVRTSASKQEFLEEFWLTGIKQL